MSFFRSHFAGGRVVVLPRPRPRPAARALLLGALLAFAGGLNAQQAFTERASLHGIDLGGSKDGGLSFGDLNGDGYLDLVVNTYKDHPSYRSRMYFSSGPPSWTFTDVTDQQASGLNDTHPGDNVMERSVVIADFNNDGYNDLVRNTAKRLELYINKGPTPADGDMPWSFGTTGQQPNFALWTPSTGDPNPPATAIPFGMNTEGIGAIDYDNDGDLDLFIENHNWGIDLYENTGFASGIFVHATPNGAGRGLPQSAVDGDYASVTDVNDDGYVDGIARKRSQEDFFLNQGDGTFLPVGGFNQDADNGNKGAVSLYDFDNDGDYDLVWTENDGNGLWVQDGVGSGNYSSTGEPWASAGLTDPDNPHTCGLSCAAIDATACGDVDNDGDIDLFFASDAGPSYLFLNQVVETGTLGFVRNNLGIDVDEDAEGCVFVDFDQDGDLDLYININGDRNQLWVNNLNTLPKGEDYLFVAVLEDRDAGGNPGGHPYRDATGANVRLLDCHGNVVSGTREVNGGNGHGTQDPARVHFGLPFGANAPYVVDVRYPYYAGSRLMTTDLVRPADLAGGIYLMTVTTTSSASVHNTAPVAVDDSLILCAGQTTITLNVAANDFDPDGDTLNVYTLVSPPANGTATVMGIDGTVVYTYTGTGPFPGDSFRYRLNDRPFCAYIGKFDEALVIIEPSPALTVSAGTGACAPDLATYDRTVTVAGGAGHGYTLDAGPYAVTALGGGAFTVSGIPAGTDLNVTVTDALGCETGGVVLTAESCPCPAVPSPVEGTGDSLCAGAAPVAIGVADPGAGFAVDWYATATGGSPVGAGTSFVPPAAGTWYAETRATVSGCVSASRLPVPLTELPPVTRAPVPGSMACESTSAWTVALTVGGGAGAPYAVSASAGTATPGTGGTWTVSGIPEGSGTVVTVTDAFGCAAPPLDLPSGGSPPWCNDPPLVVDDAVSTEEDTPVTIDVLANDSDPDDALVPGNVSLVSGPSTGTVVLNPDGTFTYTPPANWHGTTSFTYQYCDPDGACGTATVTVTVLDVNDPPVAVDDAAFTPEDTPVGVTVLANDHDPDGSLLPASVAVLSPPANGTVTVHPDGSVTYTPDADWNGVDAFTYQVCDDDGACDQATVTVTVGAVNDAPVAVDDAAFTPEDTPVSVAVLANDLDGDGTLVPGSVVILSPPANGTVTVHPDGSVTYTPDADWNGVDAFTYQVCDDGGLCDQATVTVTVGAVNDPPLAVDDLASTPEDIPVTVTVLANDTDPDGSLVPGSVTLVSPPANGTVTVHPDGSVTYAPDADWNGVDAFTYSVCDDGGLCDTATVTVSVGDVNDPPVAVDDAVATDEDTPVVVDVLLNDTDPDGTLDPATVSVTSGPFHGSAYADPVTGEIVYTPAPGWFGTDSLAYTVCDDDGACDQAWVTITVADVNDPPVALDDVAFTAEDVAVTVAVLANDHDPDGTLVPGSVAIVTPPANGTVTVHPDGSVTYTPDADWNGVDAFTYTVCDDDGACDQATVTVNVGDENDAPVAVDDSAVTDEDVPVAIDVLANDHDPDGTLDPSSVSIVSPPANGTVTVHPDGSVTYTPNPGWNGVDAFTYQVCDDDGGCSVATVTVTVNDVNDPPFALDDAAATDEDVPVSIGILANDGDSDGTLDPSSVTIVSPPANGTVTVHPDGSVTYTPNPDWNGVDAFTYSVCDDDGACATATVTVTVHDVNDPPVAVDDTEFTPEDVPVTTTVLANDHDPDGTLVPGSVTIVSPPANGTATVHPDGSITFTPDPDWNGSTSYTYQVCDDDGACDQATVTITVGDVNDPPVAVDDLVSTLEDTPVTANVLANDHDGDGSLDPGSVTILAPPAHGTATVNPDGSVTYSPGADFHGLDSLLYQVCDNDGDCDDAWLVITVGDVNDPPVAVTDPVSTPEDTPITVVVAANDSDVDGTLDLSSVSVVSPPANGTAGVNPDGSVTYTPNPDWNGTDTFTYQICDDDGACDTALVIITVTAAADGPQAVDDPVTTPEDTPITVVVAANDTDPDGDLDPTSVAIVTPPANGTAGVNPDGSVTYTPDPDWYGTDTFSYLICDGGGWCDTALVIVTVTPVADPPFAVDDVAATNEDVPVTVDVLANDVDPENDIDPGSVTVLTPPANGTATVNADGSITYTPDPGFFGTDSLQYLVCDSTGLCDDAWVVITVAEVPVALVAVDDAVSTPEEQPVSFDVLDNDIAGDYPIDPGTLSVLAAPAFGTLSAVPGTGELTYSPEADWCGTDAFPYRICDTWGYCDTAIVTITVGCIDLVANDDTASTDSGEPVTIDVLANDSPNADPDCVTLIGDPAHGTATVNPDGTVSYQPDLGFVGTDCFPYRVCDSLGVEADEAEICVEVGRIRLVIPEVFTPNGDGFNETFTIVGIEQYPDNHLMVFNRWENLVYETTGYRGEWDGVWMQNGRPLPAGTYFYVLELEPGNRALPVYKGFVQIQR